MWRLPEDDRARAAPVHFDRQELTAKDVVLVHQPAQISEELRGELGIPRCGLHGKTALCGPVRLTGTRAFDNGMVELRYVIGHPG